MRLILASASPRRREILRRAGIPFLARPSRVDETPLPGETPAAHVRRLARAKAQAARRRPGEWVLGADTVVVIGNRILGKPRNSREAARMLRSLSGRMHRVLTGLCLLTPHRSHSAVVETKVWFRPLSPTEVARYLASGEPLDKAGAYAIQGLASKFIRRIDGDYSNVVGLPLSILSRWLL
ncbi:MAG: septum formation inhibitor Maf [Acidobacteria bacterium]|nr:septum formation inhibitor Maf [Acidobacteriota bacterium]